MRGETARERLVDAAIALFEERGYDAVTVDQIAQRADVGRTTLFRLFGSKEGLIFPDHDALLAQVELRLKTAARSSALAAVVDAAGVVFDYYVKEGELAQARFRLTSTVSALRDREMASIGRYTRLFTRHLTAHLDGEPNAALRAELLATAVVTAHNHVLRRWLRAESTTPQRDFSEAMTTTLALVSRTSESRTAVVVFETNEPLESVVPRIKTTLDGKA